MVHLFTTGGHFHLRPAVYDIYFGAHSFGAAGRVHGHVASAHDGNFLRLEDRGVGLIQIGFH
ncbi:hypothetical protein SDC9_165343 [bioreactor metagenome]|uniref:Uncharacterized protein n=1 Tax=bioreactor metagenome TaxID=1076179 RepID=A0A645FU48_9ZZZZ